MTDLAPESYPTAAEDPATAARLRTTARIVAGIAALAVVCLLGSAVAFSFAARQAATLLRTGVYTPGLVTGAWTGVKGSRFMHVDYQVRGLAYASTVRITSGLTYQPGQYVTVVADPADPFHMRTVHETNESPALELACIGPLVFGLSMVITSIPTGLALRTLRRRCRSARWVPVHLGDRRTWRTRTGVTLTGGGVDVVVSPTTRAPLGGPMWALDDATAGRQVVLRTQRWGKAGGPTSVRTLPTWGPSRLTPSTAAGGEITRSAPG